MIKTLKTYVNSIWKKIKKLKDGHTTDHEGSCQNFDPCRLLP